MADKRTGRRRRTTPRVDDPVLARDAEVRGGSSAASDTAPTELPLGGRITERFECPACGTRALDFTREERAWGPHVLIHCFGCDGGLEAVHSATGLRRSRLLEWPPPAELGPRVEHGRVGVGTPALPTLEAVGQWHSALLASDNALTYLTEGRGLTVELLRSYKVGWDAVRADLTFPVIREGEVRYLYRRKPFDGAKMTAAGGPRPIYPDLPTTGALCLVAGEIDALTGRQLGLRSVTISGCTLPTHSLRYFVGRVVYVMFDVGEEAAAQRAAAKLDRLADRVSVVSLADLGLPPKGDLNDFARMGGSSTHLRDFFRLQRVNA